MIALLALGVAWADPTFDRYAPCDVPTPVLASAPAADATACEASCAATAGCGAWTFVSGWDRCRLHAPTTRHVAVRISAAVVTDGALGPTVEDHDHTGKDLESAPRDLPDAAACAGACTATTGCLGFSYVAGYRACWLKRTPGELVPKTFSCGLARPLPPDPQVR